MTLTDARAILTKPKFGDPLHIEALELLERDAKAIPLRKKLIGEKISCGPCGGTGDRCKICGPDGMVVLTKEWLDKLPLDVLEGIQAELNGEI